MASQTLKALPEINKAAKEIFDSKLEDTKKEVVEFHVAFLEEGECKKDTFKATSKKQLLRWFKRIYVKRKILMYCQFEKEVQDE